MLSSFDFVLSLRISTPAPQKPIMNASFVEIQDIPLGSSTKNTTAVSLLRSINRAIQLGALPVFLEGDPSVSAGGTINPEAPGTAPLRPVWWSEAAGSATGQGSSLTRPGRGQSKRGSDIDKQSMDRNTHEQETSSPEAI